MGTPCLETLYCACCGQPFKRTSSRGPAPLYCSRDCRRQIEVRRRAWASTGLGAQAWGMVPVATSAKPRTPVLHALAV